MFDTKLPIAKMRIVRMIIILLAGASCLPLWYQHSVAGKDWKVQASGSDSDTWYDPITGYHVTELEGGYTYSVKHEFLGGFVAHSALITGKVTKDGQPAAGVTVWFGVDVGVHYGQWHVETKTGNDGIVQVTLPNDGQLGTDLIYMYLPTVDQIEAEGESGIPLDARRRSVPDTIPWGGGYALPKKFTIPRCSEMCPPVTYR